MAKTYHFNEVGTWDEIPETVSIKARNAHIQSIIDDAYKSAQDQNIKILDALDRGEIVYI